MEVSTSERSVHKRKLSKPVLTEDDCFEEYGKHDYQGKTFSEKLKIVASDMFGCNAKKLKKTVQTVFPPLKWVRQYKPKTFFIADLIGGLTVGVMQLPQGLAYGLLASMPPIAGLYTSIWPVLAYALFGTSKHISYGASAIVSLIVGTVINQNVDKSDYVNCEDMRGTAASLVTNTATEMMINATPSSAVESIALSPECQSQYELARYEVAIALCICVCIIHFVMYVFRLGVLTSFLSSHLVSGFTCAAGFHVITSQVPKLFGLTNMPKNSGPLAFFYNWIGIFSNLYRTNIPTLIVSICCLIPLRVAKELTARYGKNLPVPIPLELLVIIFADIASYFLKLNEVYRVPVVGYIPEGIRPSAPNFAMVGNLFSGAIAIAIVTYSISMSLARKFGAGHGYKVNANQELLALGVANLLGSFFSCFPTASSLSRTSVMNEVGGKTQLVSIIASIFVLIILLALGSLFEPLPTAALASIICVSLRRIVGQFEQLPDLWRTSKIDTMVWCVSWLAVIILGVDLGLYIAVAFSLLTVAIRAMIARGEILVKVNDEIGFKPAKMYKEIKQDNTFLAFKFPSPLIYANIQRFKKQLNLAVGFNISIESLKAKLEKKKLKKETEKTSASAANLVCQDRDIEMGEPETTINGGIDNDVSHSSGSNTADYKPSKDENNQPFDYSDSDTDSEAEDEIREAFDYKTINYLGTLKHLTLDMSAVPFIDNDGVAAFKSLKKDFTELEVMMSLSNCSLNVRRTLGGGGFPEKKKEDDDVEELPMYFRSVLSAEAYLKQRSRSNGSPVVEKENGIERTSL